MTEGQMREMINSIDPEGKIPTEVVEELVGGLRGSVSLTDGEADDQIILLRERLSTEKDWKKKAAIAARIISLSLE